MSITAMQKVAVLGHAPLQGQTLTLLQKSGLMEITPFPADYLKAEAPSDYFELELAELEAAILFLDSVSGKKKNLVESFAPSKEIVEEQVFMKAAEEFNWRAVVKDLNDYKSRLSNLKNRGHTLRADIALLLPWINLKLPLNQLDCSTKTCLAAGSCKAKEFEPLKNKLEKFSSTLQIGVVNQTREKTCFMVFFLAGEAQTIQDFLAKSGFEKSPLPPSERSPAEEISYQQKLLSQTIEDQENLLEKIKSNFKRKKQLAYVYDYLWQTKLKKAAREKLAHTDKTFLISGWIPQKELHRLKKTLQAISPLLEVTNLQPKEGELPPTRIENPKIFAPFEVITRIFGLPGQSEMDPTGFLSFFYLLFFALCLSDAGYGVILSLISYWCLRRLTLSNGGKNLLLLLFWGGIAAIFAGIATGSYFGVDLGQLPPAWGSFLKRLQVIDPVKSPLNILIFSLLLGVIQNLFGIYLSMYWKIKNKNYVSAFLDDGLWIYFLLSLVLLAAASGFNSPLSQVFGKLSIAGALLLVLTQGRGEKSLIKKSLFGLLSLYKTTGYLGDTLSYSRLLALMMTTSIIGMVVNIIAGLTKDSFPILGYILMLTILIVGHTFNLIVSVLGAFIHSMRLQMVEFFGKFYGNGGREFKPFCYETKYVIIK